MTTALRITLAVLLLPLQANAAALPGPALPAPANPDAASTAPTGDPELAEIIVQAPEPRYVAPTNRDRIGRVWVPVYINDKGPFRLVLDSGATRSALTPKVAGMLDLPPNNSPPVMLRGVTGSAVAPTVRVDSISVGDLYVGPSTVPIVEDAFGGAEGLLGTDGMRGKRIFIDFRNDFINISNSRNRRAPAGFQTVPFLKDDLNLLIVEATIGNLPVRAIIDTGAQASVGNLALRTALHRQVERNLRGLDQVTGATGDVQFGVGARISPIVIGELSIRDAHITFGDMRIFERWKMMDEPAVLIGMDILGLLDTLVIDYRRMELQIKRRRDFS
ncbi:MAG: retroviral-like aspartic protease family protein [Steroidobacteraceae bacterium]